MDQMKAISWQLKRIADELEILNENITKDKPSENITKDKPSVIEALSRSNSSGYTRKSAKDFI